MFLNRWQSPPPAYRTFNYFILFVNTSVLQLCILVEQHEQDATANRRRTSETVRDVGSDRPLPDRATQLRGATCIYCTTTPVARVWHDLHANDIDRACVLFRCILCTVSQTRFNLLSVETRAGHFSATTDVLVNYNE